MNSCSKSKAIYYTKNQSFQTGSVLRVYCQLGKPKVGSKTKIPSVVKTKNKTEQEKDPKLTSIPENNRKMGCFKKSEGTQDEEVSRKPSGMHL